jgi:aminomethyltransferase
MEMCYCLYGNELDTRTTPLEAGLAWTVKLKKPQFVGKDALLRQKEVGLGKQIVGFAVEGYRIPRHGQPILHAGEPVGSVTSGGPCPSLENRGMGLGYVPPELGGLGTALTIDVRGTHVKAQVVERPFYTRASHR